MRGTETSLGERRRSYEGTSIVVDIDLLYVHIGRPHETPLVSLRFDRIALFTSRDDTLRIIGAFPDAREIPSALLEPRASGGRGPEVVRLGSFDAKELCALVHKLNIDLIGYRPLTGRHEGEATTDWADTEGRHIETSGICSEGERGHKLRGVRLVPSRNAEVRTGSIVARGFFHLGDAHEPARLEAYMVEPLGKRASGFTVRVEGPKSRQSYFFDSEGPRIVFGRKRGNAIALVSESIAREHGAITFENGRFYVEDFGTTNGCVMDGVRLGRGRFLLRDRTELVVGDHLLTFHPS